MAILFHGEFAKRQWKTVTILTVAIVIVAASLAFMFAHRPQDSADVQDIGVAVGQRAQDFALERFKGHMTRLSDFGGQAVLLDFWTSWDPMSREDLAGLEASFQKYRQKGFSVIAIHRTRSELRKTAEDFVKANGYTFPVLFDATGGLYDMYSDGSNVTPVKVLIDRRGVILEKAFGTKGMSDSAIEKALR